MPRALPDEVLEDVLLRLPPHEPKVLVRAALVSRRWCRLISDAGFRRRFREFHRRPPTLGMLENRYSYDPDFPNPTAWFDPATAFCTPRKTFRDMSVLDVRHGRVLLDSSGYSLVLWDPITNKVRNLPFPWWKKRNGDCAAAVICSAAGCDHLDCHEGPFLVVLLCSEECGYNESGNAVIYTYSSNAAAWSEPVCAEQEYTVQDYWICNALVGNSIYFKNGLGSGTTALKFDLDLCQVSFILLPLSLPRITLRESMLVTMDDGGLGLIYTEDSKLYMWSRKETPEVDAKWESRVIELKPLFPDDGAVTRLISVTGSGVGTIFMSTEYQVYTIDLKTNEVKMVWRGSGDKLFPYMSFYTPALAEVRKQAGKEKLGTSNYKYW